MAEAGGPDRVREVLGGRPFVNGDRDGPARSVGRDDIDAEPGAADGSTPTRPTVPAGRAERPENLVHDREVTMPGVQAVVEGDLSIGLGRCRDGRGFRLHGRDAAETRSVPRSIVCRTAAFEAGQERNAVAPLSKARLRSGSVGVLVTTTTAVRGENSRMRRRRRRSLAARGPAARKSACTAPLGQHGKHGIELRDAVGCVALRAEKDLELGLPVRGLAHQDDKSGPRNCRRRLAASCLHRAAQCEGVPEPAQRPIPLTRMVKV